MSKVVIVLGDARSGTSVTSGMLQSIGVDMNGNEGRKCIGNPHGSFEDRSVIFETMKWKQELDNGATIEQLKHRHKDWVKTWAEKRSSALWGFKSAQTHYTLDILMPYLKNPHFVFVFRNPFHQAISLGVGEQKEISHGIDPALLNKRRTIKATTIIHYLRNIAEGYDIVNDIMKRYAHVPKTFVAKEDIAEDPIPVAEGLCKFLGQPFTADVRAKVESTVIRKYSSWKKGGITIDWGNG